MVELAKTDPKIALVATVKETGVDDQGLIEFYTSFFDSHPMYKDEKWQLYKAMGGGGGHGRTLSLWQLFKATLIARKRWKSKGIHNSANNYKSDPWMQGGVLIFDKQGHLVYALEEETGVEFSMDRLQKAIQGARKVNNSFTEQEGTKNETNVHESTSITDVASSTDE